MAFSRLSYNGLQLKIDKKMLSDAYCTQQSCWSEKLLHRAEWKCALNKNFGISNLVSQVSFSGCSSFPAEKHYSNNIAVIPSIDFYRNLPMSYSSRMLCSLYQISGCYFRIIYNQFHLLTETILKYTFITSFLLWKNINVILDRKLTFPHIWIYRKCPRACWMSAFEIWKVNTW